MNVSIPLPIFLDIQVFLYFFLEGKFYVFVVIGGSEVAQMVKNIVNARFWIFELRWVDFWFCEVFFLSEQ